MSFSLQCRTVCDVVECFKRVFSTSKITFIIDELIKKHYSSKQSAKLTPNFMSVCTTSFCKEFPGDGDPFSRYVLRAAFALIEYQHMVMANSGATYFAQASFKDKYYDSKYFFHVSEEELRLLVLFREFAAASLRTMVNPKCKEAMVMFIVSSFSEGKMRTYIMGGNQNDKVNYKLWTAQAEVARREEMKMHEVNVPGSMRSTTYEHDELLFHGNQTPALHLLPHPSPPLLHSPPELGEDRVTPLSQLPAPPSSNPSPTLPVLFPSEFENTADLGGCDPLLHSHTVHISPPNPLPLIARKRKSKDGATNPSRRAKKKFKHSSPSKSTGFLSSFSPSPSPSSLPMPSHESPSPCPPSITTEATEPLPDPFSSDNEPKLCGDSLDCPVEDMDLYSHTLDLLTFPRVCALACDTDDIEGTDDEDCSTASQFDRLAGRVCAGPGCQWVDLALLEHDGGDLSFSDLE